MAGAAPPKPGWHRRCPRTGPAPSCTHALAALVLIGAVPASPRRVLGRDPGTAKRSSLQGAPGGDPGSPGGSAPRSAHQSPVIGVAQPCFNPSTFWFPKVLAPRGCARSSVRGSER